jgi:hypothetical protein
LEEGHENVGWVLATGGGEKGSQPELLGTEKKGHLI